MRNLICLLFLISPFILPAQDTAIRETIQNDTLGIMDKDTSKIFTHVEEKPQYPGGDIALYGFLNKNLIYPAIAKENGIEGRVIISFTIQKDGSVADVKAILKIGYGLEEEAVRVVKLLPKWTPGKQNNKPVNVKYHLPVLFKLY